MPGEMLENRAVQGRLWRTERMRPVVRAAMAALFALATLPAAADDLAIERILVMDISADEADGVIAREASEELASVARQVLEGVEVLDQQDVRKILQAEAERMLLGCEDDSLCLAELGGAMGASHIATGTIRRIGDRYGIDLRLIDSARAMNLRHVRERGLDDPYRVLDAVAILGAHLFDPSLPPDGGLLDIGGSGQVILDGVFIGSAPMRRVRVRSGSRRVIWQTETRIEATVEVEPFGTHRVDPSMGRPARAGGAPATAAASPARSGPSRPARAAPAAEPGQPGTDLGDLGNWRVSAGLGGGAFIGYDRAPGIGTTTLTFDLGYTLDSGLDLGLRHRAVVAGEHPERVGFNATSLGLGYVMGHDLRFRIATYLGGSRWSVFHGGTPDSGLVRQQEVNAFNGRRGLAWELGADLRYAFARYIELGVDAGIATATHNGTFTSTHVLVIWGVPARHGLYHRPMPYRRNSNFILASTLVVAGGLLTLAVTGYNALPDS